jgi:hypothetical protein
MDSLDTGRERFAASEQPTEAWTPQTHAREVPTCPGDRRRRWWPLAWPVAAVATLGLATALPGAGQAKTFSCDAGDVTCLIDAINQANANGEQNTIRLQAGTYPLTAPNNGENGLPVITSRLTITGEGAETTIIERDASAPAFPGFRFFMVAESGTLSLERLTLRGGGSLSGLTGGGAISNSGTLTVTRSTITDNKTSGGGAGIFNRGTATIANSTLAHNDGLFESGALTNDGTMVITATTFADNSADGASAILNGGTLTVTNSTFTDNITTGSGAGAVMNFGTLGVSNTTFARNMAGGFFCPPGAAISNGGTLVLTQSTLADNVVSEAVGSALLSARGATTILQNTLIARNVEQSPFDPSWTRGGPDCRGVVTSFGNNLIGDATGCTIIRPPGVRDLTGDPG